MALLASGCGSTFLASLNGHFAPTAERGVEIYRSSEPSWPYTVIGTFQFNTQKRRIGGTFEALREYAAAAGADGIIGLQREIWIEAGMHPRGDPFHVVYRGQLVRRQ